MHEIRLANITNDEQLRLAVLQVGQMLGFYNAEMARVLGIRCEDIGALNAMQCPCALNSATADRARRLVALYELLFDVYKGNEVTSYNWLRRANADLEGQPLLLIVDEGRIDEVIHYLASRNTADGPQS